MGTGTSKADILPSADWRPFEIVNQPDIIYDAMSVRDKSEFADCQIEEFLRAQEVVLEIRQTNLQFKTFGVS